MKNILLYSFLTLSIFLLSPFTFSQDVSTKGQDFWFGYMKNQGSGSTGMRAYISSSSSLPITGEISIPNVGWSQNFTINPNSTLSIQLPENDVHPPKSEGIFNAVHITSCDSINVYAQNAHSNSNDATVVYPTAALKDKYMSLNWDQTGYPGYNRGDEILIVATEDNTEIEITPTTNTNGGHLANVPYTITLNQGETYQIINTEGTDPDRVVGNLTGTTIEGTNTGDCKPFAVFSGSFGTCVGNGGTGDNLFSQLLPTTSLGKDYVLVPLEQKSNTYYRIMATENNTSVEINGGTPIILNKGEYHQFKNNVSSYVEGDKPIMVMQYAQSNGADGDGVGDPFQILMYPNDQSIKNIAFNAFTLNTGTIYWINIVTETANVANTTLDGNNIAAEFSPVPSNNNLSYARINIAQGNHLLYNPNGVLCYVYAWGDPNSSQSYESFGYCTGAAVRDLNNYFTSTPNPTCTGSTIDFATTSDGISSGYEWDFGDSSAFTNGLNTTHEYDDEGVYTVTLTKERPGCDVLVKQNVSIINPPISINLNDTTVCEDTPLQLTVEASYDSIPNYQINDCGDSTVSYQSSHFDSFTWSNGETDSQIEVMIDKDTVIYVNGYQSGTTCLGVDSINVTATVSEADFSLNDFCVGTSNSADNIVHPGGTFSIISPLGDGATIDASTGELIDGVGGTTYIIEYETTQATCPDSKTEEVTVFPTPSFSINATDPTCGQNNGEIVIVPEGGTVLVDYSIDNGVTLENEDTFSNLSPGDYTVFVKDENGCEATQAQTLTNQDILDDPSFTLTDFCVGTSNSADNIATPGGSFSIISPTNDGAVIDASTGEISNGTEGTTYTIEYQTTGACSDTHTEEVTVLNSPVIDFTADPTEGAPPLEVVFENNVSGSDDYHWNFGDGNSVQNNSSTLSHLYEEEGEYLVVLTATTNKNCIDTSSIQIVVAIPPMEYTFPNIFTPNNDNQNDFFKLQKSEGVESIEIIILNRWGNIVFEDNTLDFSWNGKVNNTGLECEDGTYFYKAQLIGMDGKEETAHGFVQLVRSK